MKKCSSCKIEKPLDSFNFKVKALGKRSLQCKDCTRSSIKKHYYANKQYYLSKTKNRNNYLRNQINIFLKGYLLQHPCIDCGEKDITVLEFDHTGLKPKLKAVSRLIRDRAPLNLIKAEVDKCEVRCANCHRRKTARDFNWFKI